jgi:hypothetical protein
MYVLICHLVLQATCTQFDQVRCDVATLVQLRRHIDVVLKPERDELRTKVAARKVRFSLCVHAPHSEAVLCILCVPQKAATPGVPTPFAASASATPTAASAVKKRVLPAVPVHIPFFSFIFFHCVVLCVNFSRPRPTKTSNQLNELASEHKLLPILVVFQFQIRNKFHPQSCLGV